MTLSISQKHKSASLFRSCHKTLLGKEKKKSELGKEKKFESDMLIRSINFYDLVFYVFQLFFPTKVLAKME